ncbi:hypothetical protein HanRHA438_Chr15g0688671 [Helianthus annuus]|uniref:Uncharacterized protein n=1 Tax=Helianthus annuus TaxID=4232 RepID=A0A251S5E8_HELAN|nr:hypothetical protein HanXRQr2_Chr15g0676241 [Helianthus annuus]KAJ0471787.1 hypothetical protein HanHA89_Chr15g0599921 [Helianthus annuus]KAJ0843191.1 hypothetical protein HanRHA438_Chr15g0688671 [Helianthus annuus]
MVHNNKQKLTISKFKPTFLCLVLSKKFWTIPLIRFLNFMTLSSDGVVFIVKIRRLSVSVAGFSSRLVGN